MTQINGMVTLTCSAPYTTDRRSIANLLAGMFGDIWVIFTTDDVLDTQRPM